MQEIDDSKAPLLEHLVELRRRLIRCLIAVGLAFAVCYYFSRYIYSFLVHPLLQAGHSRVYFTQMFEAFFVELKVALFGAVMIAFPIIANQLWQFVAPGLYAREKRALLPFLFATPILFLTGAALAYFVAIPFALKFLLGLEGNFGGVEQQALPSAGDYLSFVMQFMLAFGIAFLIPIALMLLEMSGVVTRAQLVASRRYAIVGAVVIAAVLTPPDPGSQLLLAIPLCLLYEATLLAIWISEKRRKAQRAPGGTTDPMEEPSEVPGTKDL